jgi:hypothetical protein
MPVDDPSSWTQGAAALKSAFDGIRSAIGVVKDIRGLGGGSEQQQKGTSKYDAFGACLAAVRIVTDFENDLSPTRFPFLPARGARGALRADSALMPQPSAPA